MPRRGRDRRNVPVANAPVEAWIGRGNMLPRNPPPTFVEPSGALHWRSGAQASDGAACGAQGVRFTGDTAAVQCAKCRRLVKGGGR